jgi:hypothetical protein
MALINSRGFRQQHGMKQAELDIILADLERKGRISRVNLKSGRCGPRRDRYEILIDRSYFHKSAKINFYNALGLGISFLGDILGPGH